MFLFYGFLNYIVLVFSSVEPKKHPLFFETGRYLKNKSISAEDWLVFIIGGICAFIWLLYLIFVYFKENSKDKY